MKKLDLLIDMDGVCAELVDPILAEHNLRFGTSYKESDIKTYDGITKLNPGGMPFFQEMLVRPGLIRNLKPIDGACEALKKLSDAGHKIFIVSAVPTGISFDEKKEWLKEHLSFIPKENFVAVESKYQIRGNVLLDDAPHHIHDFAETKRLAVVFDKPWNQEVQSTRFIARISTWAHFAELVLEGIVEKRLEEPAGPDIEVLWAGPDSSIAPRYMTQGSVGADIRSAISWIIDPGKMGTIHTGIHIVVPEGYEAQVRLRSSLGRRQLTIPHGLGTIDSDYRGELFVTIHNLGTEPQLIEDGDRIAQLVFAPIVRASFTRVSVSELPKTDRGAGSTGRK